MTKISNYTLVIRSLTSQSESYVHESHECWGTLVDIGPPISRNIMGTINIHDLWHGCPGSLVTHAVFTQTMDMALTYSLCKHFNLKRKPLSEEKSCIFGVYCNYGVVVVPFAVSRSIFVAFLQFNTFWNSKLLFWSFFLNIFSLYLGIFVIEFCCFQSIFY